MKAQIQKIFNKFGYQISNTRKNYDLSLYEKLFESNSIKNKKFFNIGSADFFHPAWSNVDFVSKWYDANTKYTNKGNIDIEYDLMSLEPFPLKSDYAEIVYCSHTVEHISNDAAQNLFNESFRILKNDGVFRVTTPNIDLVHKAYVRNDKDFFYWIVGELPPIKDGEAQYKKLDDFSTDQNFLFYFASILSLASNDSAKKIDDTELRKIFDAYPYEDALNHIIDMIPPQTNKKYPGLHMNWWNFSKLSRMLKKAGFNDVYLSAYGQSSSPVLRDTAFFDNTHPKVSIYVEARKS
ncbi:MAG: methyltransferase domain-containing protein [Nitrosopumilus sp.]|nr:methyltransferase domain-containing protein [Nitrosopumilus sp.]